MYPYYYRQPVPINPYYNYPQNTQYYNMQHPAAMVYQVPYPTYTQSQYIKTQNLQNQTIPQQQQVQIDQSQAINQQEVYIPKQLSILKNNSEDDIITVQENTQQVPFQQVYNNMQCGNQNIHVYQSQSIQQNVKK